MADGLTGTAYDVTLAATSGVAPYTWTLDTTSAALQRGLSLSSATGEISGTPIQAGTRTLVVKVTDSVGDSVTKSLPLFVDSSILSVDTGGLPNNVGVLNYVQRGIAYKDASSDDPVLAHLGGAGPYSWSTVSGSLPAGLQLDSSTGTISGTPTAAAGEYDVTFQVADSEVPVQTATADVKFKLVDPVAVTTSALDDAVLGSSYSATLVASGGDGPTYHWALADDSDPPPNWLHLDASTGALTGTPSGTPGGPPYGLKFVAIDDASGFTSAEQSLPLTLDAAVAISTTNLDGWVANAAPPTHAMIVTATGGKPATSLPHYLWAFLASPTPPSWLIASSTNDQIGGTPSHGGEWKFTLKATDSLSHSATQDETVYASPLFFHHPSTSYMNFPAGAPMVDFNGNTDEPSAAPGSTTTFVVPANVTRLHVVVVGGRGADSGSNGAHSSGGAGEKIATTLDVGEGDHLTIDVGGGGGVTEGLSCVCFTATGPGGAGAYAGGAGAPTDNLNASSGGGGGAASAISESGVPLVVAGGGGGGAGARDGDGGTLPNGGAIPNGGNAGNVGSSTGGAAGQAGADGGMDIHGTANQGGSGGLVASGANTGGDASGNYYGGGGGGYGGGLGGHGGQTSDDPSDFGGGGGGGASYVAPNAVISSSTTSALAGGNDYDASGNGWVELWWT